MRRPMPLTLLAAGLLALAAAPVGAAPITTGEPQAMPELRFQDLDGKPAALDAFRGQVVVLNLWATWCVPCREEMPSLDRLQALVEGEPVRVVALSVDRAGPERVKGFVDEIGVRHLAVYQDRTAQAARTLRLPGLPATLLIDPDGREVGRVMGTAPWDGAEALAAVRRLERPGPGAAPLPEVTRTGS